MMNEDEDTYMDETMFNIAKTRGDVMSGPTRFYWCETPLKPLTTSRSKNGT